MERDEGLGKAKETFSSAATVSSSEVTGFKSQVEAAPPQNVGSIRGAYRSQPRASQQPYAFALIATAQAEQEEAKRKIGSHRPAEDRDELSVGARRRPLGSQNRIPVVCRPGCIADSQAYFIVSFDILQRLSLNCLSFPFLVPLSCSLLLISEAVRQFCVVK